MNKIIKVNEYSRGYKQGKLDILIELNNLMIKLTREEGYEK